MVFSSNIWSSEEVYHVRDACLNPQRGGMIKCLAERKQRGTGKSSFYHQIGITEYYDYLNGIKQTDPVLYWTFVERPHTTSIPRAAKRTRCQPFNWCPSVKPSDSSLCSRQPALERPQLPKEQWWHHLPKAGAVSLQRKRPKPYQLNWWDLLYMLVSLILKKKEKRVIIFPTPLQE